MTTANRRLRRFVGIVVVALCCPFPFVMCAGVAEHLEATGRIELDSWHENQGRAKIVIEQVFKVRGSERTPVTAEDEAFNCLSADGSPGQTVTLPVGSEILLPWKRIKSKSILWYQFGKDRCPKGQSCILLEVDPAGLPMSCGARQAPMYWAFKEDGETLRSLSLLVTVPKKHPWARWFTVKSAKARERMKAVPDESIPRVSIRFSWDHELTEQASKDVAVEVRLDRVRPKKSAGS
jgi:hypothetical protein